MEAVILPGGAIGVQHRSYSVRYVWRAIPSSSRCVGGVPWAPPCGAWGVGSWL